MCEGPEDYNLLYGAWLKASSPIKNHLVRQQNEGSRDGGDRVVGGGFGRNVDFHIDVPLSPAAGGDAVTAVAGQSVEQSVIGSAEQFTRCDDLKRGNIGNKSHVEKATKGNLVRKKLEGLLVDNVMGQSGLDIMLENQVKPQSVENVRADNCSFNREENSVLHGPSLPSGGLNLGLVEPAGNMGLIPDIGVMEVDLAMDCSKKKNSNVCGRTLSPGDEGQLVIVDGIKKGRWKRRARAESRVDCDMVSDNLLGKHLLVDGITPTEKKLKSVDSCDAPHGKSVVSTDISAEDDVVFDKEDDDEDFEEDVVFDVVDR
ncbi:hypothetical protein Q3G72_011894 [Acer saccharum]|nr:hypothetical protein Q3G72_011894 [Acer saccharum]